MDKPVDFLGAALEVGDSVVYPVRKGSRMWMNVGTILAIETWEDGGDFAHNLTIRKSSGRVTHIWNCSTVTKISPNKAESRCSEVCQCMPEEKSPEYEALRESDAKATEWIDMSDVKDLEIFDVKSGHYTQIPNPRRCRSIHHPDGEIVQYENKHGRNIQFSYDKDSELRGVIKFNSYSGFTWPLYEGE